MPRNVEFMYCLTGRSRHLDDSHPLGIKIAIVNGISLTGNCKELSICTQISVLSWGKTLKSARHYEFNSPSLFSLQTTF